MFFLLLLFVIFSLKKRFSELEELWSLFFTRYKYIIYKDILSEAHWFGLWGRCVCHVTACMVDHTGAAVVSVLQFFLLAQDFFHYSAFCTVIVPVLEIMLHLFWKNDFQGPLPCTQFAFQSVLLCFWTLTPTSSLLHHLFWRKEIRSIEYRWTEL